MTSRQSSSPNVGLITHEGMYDHIPEDQEGKRSEPERPERIRHIWNALRMSGIADRCKILGATEAEDRHLMLVHEEAHVNMIKRISVENHKSMKNIAGRFDSIYLSEGSSTAASLAAGAVIQNQYLRVGFAMHRGDEHGGHYTAAVSYGDDWIIYDDDRVTISNDDELAKHSRSTRDIYMKENGTGGELEKGTSQMKDRMLKEVERCGKSNMRIGLRKSPVQEGVETRRIALSKGANTKKKVSKSRKAGLLFPVCRIRRYLKRTVHYSRRVEVCASVEMTAALEYLVSEALTLAGNVARERKKKRISPRMLRLAISGDDEFTKLLDRVIIAQGGVA